MVVLLVAAGSIVSSVQHAARLGNVNRERMRAIDAAELVLERLRSEPLERVHALYDADPENDPDGPGTGPGARFAVLGLTARAGAPQGLAGRVEFPGAGNELREDFVDPELGMPRDLDGDGLIDDAEHSGAYRLLPVRIVVQWTGAGGAGELALVTTLTDI